MYVRRIQVCRAKTNSDVPTAVGLAPYSGIEGSTTAPAGQTILFTAIPASIQASQMGRKKDAALPQDAVWAPTWRIFIPLIALPKGSVRDRDIVIDDEGYRYEVAQAYWNILGYQLVCIRLEA